MPPICRIFSRLIFIEFVPFNPLTPNDHYSGRTATLTSKRCILYIYSTKIGTEYFKHGIYSPFFFSIQNEFCFIILTHLVPVLFTFYIFIQLIQVLNILNMVYILLFISIQNAFCFIILTYLFPVLFTFYIFIQQIQVPNILNMVYTHLFFLSQKCILFHNSNVFGSCIIHVLYTECAEIKKKIIPARKG